MALMPKRIKHRKSQRGRIRGVAQKGNRMAYGDFGLQSLESGWVTAQQIEAGRVAATHFLHREGRVYLRLFPDKPISTRPLETRMGKGKGEPSFWVAVVKAGRILYEIGGVDEPVAKQALARVAHKMPVKCRFVHRGRAV
jgi:large subunit ribosomal protein L16